MTLEVVHVAEAFCSHRFAETYPYMAEDINWDIVGKEVRVGREAVINSCSQAASFLETVSATRSKLKIHRAEACVVVEGAAQFRVRDNEISCVASCDVFQFSDGRLVEITSYVIELNKP